MIRFVRRSTVRNESRLTPSSRTTLERSPRKPMHTTTLAQRCLCAALLTLALAGACSRGDGRDRDNGATGGRAPTTTATAATTSVAVTTPLQSDEAVLTAYREFFRVFDDYSREQAAFDPADFKTRFSPVAVASGGEYEHLFETFQLDRLKGLVHRGGEGDQRRPRITERQPARAVVEDCADDTGGIWDSRNNTWAEPETPGAHSFFRVVLVVEDNWWKVTSVGGEDRPCTP